MSARAAALRVWEDLPFWFLWFAPFALLDLARNQLGQAILPSLLAFALPFAAATWLRRHAFPGRGWTGYAAASLGLLVLVLLGWTGPGVPLELLPRVFEAAAMVELAVLLAHAARFGGWRVVAPLFGVGAVYGLILENGGILLGFFQEPGYRLMVPPLPAPLATALGWCVVFYPFWFCVRKVAPAAGPFRRALLLTGLALAFDLQLDPLATAAGFWVWHPSLPPAIRGVPLVNFNAWASAVLPFAWAVFQVEREARGAPARRLALLLPAVVLAALAMVLLLTLLTEVSIGWPSLARFASILSP